VLRNCTESARKRECTLRSRRGRLAKREKGEGEREKETKRAVCLERGKMKESK